MGWLQSYPTILVIIVTHYLDILPWIYSMFLVCCNRCQFPNNHLFSPCSLRVPHRYLTGILKTWWLQICSHVTPLGCPRVILPESVCRLSFFLPHIGRMGWFENHIPQDPSPDSCRTVMRFIVSHITPFLFEPIVVVFHFFSWWNYFGITWVMPSPWSRLVIIPLTLLHPRLFLCEYIPPGCQMWPCPNLHMWF